MMLVYPPVGLEAHILKEKVLTLVVENPKIFYGLTRDIYLQINGVSGETVISEDYKPINLSKAADIITQFIPFTVNKKDILSNIYSVLKEKSVDGSFYTATQELYMYIERYLYELTEEATAELKFCPPQDISPLLKAFDLRISEDDKTLGEKLLEYFIASRDYKGRSIFITVNLCSYMSNKELAALFQSVLLHDLTLICIESKASSPLKNETRIIIDEDMCII